jgi:Virulence-associated protein E/Domain of unknown function (DUF3854)
MSAAQSFGHPMQHGVEVTEADPAKLADRWITLAIACDAFLGRVDSAEGREMFGRRSGNMAGIIIPYFLPGETVPCEYRLRRDEPDYEIDPETKALKPKGRYLGAPGRPSRLYFVPGTTVSDCQNVALDVVLVEGEFKALAVNRAACYQVDKPRWRTISIPGVWGWKGNVGKEVGPDGSRLDVKGVLPDFNLIKWAGRTVYIAFDADLDRKEQARWGRVNLVRELTKRGANVVVVRWAEDLGKGPDDYLAKNGPEAFYELLANARKLVENGGWKDSLLRGRPRGKEEKGPILSNLSNCVMALRLAPEWSGVLAYNALKGEIEIKSPAPFGKKPGTAWADHDNSHVAMWLQSQGINVPSTLAAEAVDVVCRDETFNPLLEYLDSLEWDGVPRLGTGASRYFGSEKEIHNIFFKKWMISAVARAKEPGCKADCALILEGIQGKKKSTALNALAGDEFFSDQIATLGSKDASMATRGVWVVELAELESMHRAEIGAVKAFLSVRFDRFRPPYGRQLVTWPRSCVFAGSVNDSRWLRDPTGGRRFWPIKCALLNTKALEDDRGQLWAEAVSEYLDGKPWWIEDDATIAAAEEEQLDRYQGGVWDAIIAEWLVNPTQRMQSDRNGYSTPIEPFTSKVGSVTSADILTHAIGKDVRNWKRDDEMNVAAALQTLGWERYRAQAVRTELCEVGTDEVGTAAKRVWRYRPRGTK